MKSIVEYCDERNVLILQSWQVLNNLFKIQGSDNFTDEDLDLWTCVTKHSAIQNKIII